MYTVLMLVLFLLLAAGMTAWIVAPRRTWWATMAWRYSDPPANEPSDAAFAASRVVSAIGVLVLVVVAVGVVWGDYAQHRTDVERFRQDYRDCLEQNRPLTETPFIPLPRGQSEYPVADDPSGPSAEEQCADLSPTPGS